MNSIMLRDGLTHRRSGLAPTTGRAFAPGTALDMDKNPPGLPVTLLRKTSDDL